MGIEGRFEDRFTVVEGLVAVIPAGNPARRYGRRRWTGGRSMIIDTNTAIVAMMIWREGIVGGHVEILLTNYSIW